VHCNDDLKLPARFRKLQLGAAYASTMREKDFNSFSSYWIERDSRSAYYSVSVCEKLIFVFI